MSETTFKMIKISLVLKRWAKTQATTQTNAIQTTAITRDTLQVTQGQEQGAMSTIIRIKWIQITMPIHRLEELQVVLKNDDYTIWSKFFKLFLLN